ncbi:YwqG family protein [Chryseobacterium gregarium]|uniref:YwqG family protein n=1 Tax=Chryseobacterium gregarium TaxID=456299 RepID=UPI000407F21E|nr:YwqG family protein [Chryseobacterium gregarium]
MIPEFLSEFKDQLEKYKLETIKINAVPLADHESLQIHNSKFLGKPYVPKSMEYPKDKQNNPMILWAQINFAETPEFADYPDHGILQFFVSADWFDMDDYKVIFHESTSEEFQTDFSFLTEDMYEESPIYSEHKLIFKKETEYGSSEDFRFDMQFNGKDHWDFYETLDKAQKKLFDKILSGDGHKMGGYAYFTQADIRDYNEKLKQDVLLLQIDTDEEIMFGDSGVANFFINPEDLKNRTFEKAWFNWDCC